MPRRSRTTADQRRRLLARWAGSGLSAAAFSQRSGVAAWALYRWRREARAEADADATATGSAAPAFAEIVLRSSSGDGSAPESAPVVPPIEILVGDARVQVGQAFDDEHLYRVLDVLRRAS